MYPSFNYLGSKTKLLDFLKNSIENYTKTPLTNIKSFIDGFSGTGIVSYYMISQGIPQVITNDLQYYSYVISSVLSKQNLDIEKLKVIITQLNHINTTHPTSNDFIYNNYTNSPNCERMYITQSNAIKIDRIRQNIDHLLKSKSINPTEFNCLLKLLLYATTKISNTSSTYGAYLKEFKPSSQKDLLLDPSLIDKLNAGDISNHTSLNYNILDIPDHFFNSTEICYLDPPYNSRDYSSNYHLLETIAKYDSPNIKGKTGLRNDNLPKSKFCSKINASHEFNTLFSKIKSKYLFLSYSSESILSKTHILELLHTNWTNVICYEKEYQRFKSNTNCEQRKTVTEYLFAATNKSF
jgi:adenine-specific DNA-methyltransferase